MTSKSAKPRLQGPSPGEQPQGKKIIYLACPYTDPDSKVREQRFHAATKAAAKLIERGAIVYSPITMTHPIDIVLAGTSETLGSDYWVTFDEAFMDVCSEMVILRIHGWDQSGGIRREIGYFEKQGKPVRFMSPDDDTISAGRKDPKQQKKAAR